MTAHRAGSGAAILLTYRYTPAALVEGTALSVQSILDGYPEETSGTLFIVQNNQVIASNRPELIGQDTTDSPTVQEIRKVGVAEMLTHTRGWDGSGSYFGMYSHGRTFDLYAYTDEMCIRDRSEAVPAQDGKAVEHGGCSRGQQQEIPCLARESEFHIVPPARRKGAGSPSVFGIFQIL